MKFWENGGVAMERIRFFRPAPDLEHVVRCYVQRHAAAVGAELLQPVPARASPILEFVLADLFEVHWCDRPVIETTPRAVMIGLQTHRRVRLKVKGKLESFCIVFQPGGLFRLFSVPLHELTDHDCEARAVLGPWVSRLREQLGECGSFGERARITDECLRHFSRLRTCSDGVSGAANEILLRHGDVSIPDLANRACLSLRQFERRFHDQVGMRPKLYSRIARFEAALDGKAVSYT